MDWGALGGAGLGLFGQLFNRNQQNQTSNQYFGMGAPYRDRLQAITNDPSLYYNSPDAQALANQSDRRYSAIVGNPAGSGTAQAGALEAMLRGYGAERDRLFNYGGGAYFNRAAPDARTAGMGSNMGVFRSLGPLYSLLSGSGSGGGSSDIGSLFSNQDYMGGGGMGLS
jgi:hypothetical protein